jgi:hypothetical protein
MKYLIHVDEQYFHIVGGKRSGIEHKFWILWTQVLDILKFRINEKTERCSLGRHCEIVGTFNSN